MCSKHMSEFVCQQLDDVFITATAENYHRDHELGNVIKPVFAARENKEDTEE